ncbi:MAG: hypothetical protein J7M14_07260, partial [Planctomycetes bacterium]|nr:hypothetical protein [Planctomycetota bacterium]
VRYYEKNIEAAKAFGFNFVRFHSKVPPREFFDAADRLGLLAHVEVRPYFGKYQKEKRELLDHDPFLVDPRHWMKTIRMLRNHTSLMAYCLGNEVNNPGRRPEVKQRAAQLRRLDTTRLFIDTCARGEFDRTGVDFDVQHMGYFAPFGKNYGMFETTSNWAVFGSVNDYQMITGKKGAQTRRAIDVNIPVIAHEVGHYMAMRDIDSLDAKFAKCPAAKPWWVDELRKLRDLKGLKADYPRMMLASRKWQYVWHKQVFESVRRSKILCGYHFLQLSDTELYENSNGLVDCFDDLKKGTRPKDYLPFNSDVAILADLPQRSFFEGDSLDVGVSLSNYSDTLTGEGNLKWSLKSVGSKAVSISGRLPRVDFQGGLNKLADLEIELPATGRALALKLTIAIDSKVGVTSRNSWNLWLFPNRPETLAISRATVALEDIDLYRRYPQLKQVAAAKLLITNRFSNDVFKQLERGGDVLMLWRVGETRSRAVTAEKEKYYMPSTWDRFKQIIWDRGHNNGGFMRPHPALRGFPHDGYVDFQFHHLIDDCDKFSLDGFPVAVSPAIQGVDKSSRDRFDVAVFKLSELQPAWTMRKFAYLFDLKLGRGRLMMCAFNFTGLNDNVPEVCGMFESIIAGMAKASWKPKAKISPADLKNYLAKMGRKPRIRERMMTQYWQLDAQPIESTQYWKDSEAWCRGTLKL